MDKILDCFQISSITDSTQIDECLAYCKEMLNLTQNAQEINTNLDMRVTALEEAIDKVPEFYEYWKRFNACGYQD